jgi:hypothetical protein
MISDSLTTVLEGKSDHLHSSTPMLEEIPTRAPTGWVDLPLELRLHIYHLATDYHIGRNLVEANQGRLQFRLAWPMSPLEYRSARQLRVDDVAQISRQTRRDLLPLIMRGYIVKFPAWTPGFKLQCIHWIDDVSELFCRSMDWIWLEGLYWRLSIHLVPATARPGDGAWEDERARQADVHRHEGSATYARDGFVLRVDYAAHVERNARACGSNTVALLEDLLDAAAAGHEERGRLGKREIGILLRRTALTGWQQMREGVESDGTALLHV